MQSRAGAEKLDLGKLILRCIFQPLREAGREGDDAIELAIIAGGGAARLAQMCDLAAFQGGREKEPRQRSGAEFEEERAPRAETKKAGSGAGPFRFLLCWR